MNEISLFASSLTALAAGVLSFLSPCVLPLMPAYLSFVSGLSLEELRLADAEAEAARSRRSRTLLGSVAFVAGFSAVFVALGASASALGQALGGLRWEVGGVTITPATLAGLVIILFGLHLTGALPIHWLYRERRFEVGEAAGPFAAALLGAAFAFGWTPCIGPVLAGILTLAAAQDTVGRGVFLLSLYSAGLGLPFLAMALSIDRFFRLFGRIRRHFRAIEIVAGLLLVGVGLLVMTGRLTLFNRYFMFLNDLIIRLEEWLL